MASRTQTQHIPQALIQHCLYLILTVPTVPAGAFSNNLVLLPSQNEWGSINRAKLPGSLNTCAGAIMLGTVRMVYKQFHNVQCNVIGLRFVFLKNILLYVV